MLVLATNQLAPFEEDKGYPLSRAPHDHVFRQGFALVALDVHLQDHLLGLYGCLSGGGRFCLS